MALTPASILSALQAVRGLGQFVLGGPLSDQLLAGIANGVSSWAISQPGNLQLTGTAVGTVGAGTVVPATTLLVVGPKEGLITANLSGAGVAGPVAPSLGRVVAFGIAQAFTTSAQYFGVSSGVGVGQDVSVITVSNPSTLASLLVSTLSGTFGSAGPTLSNLALGLGIGIASMLLGATGTGTVTGASGPSPASGVTTSVVV